MKAKLFPRVGVIGAPMNCKGDSTLLAFHIPLSLNMKFP